MTWLGAWSRDWALLFATCFCPPSRSNTPTKNFLYPTGFGARWRFIRKFAFPAKCAFGPAHPLAFHLNRNATKKQRRKICPGTKSILGNAITAGCAKRCVPRNPNPSITQKNMSFHLRTGTILSWIGGRMWRNRPVLISAKFGLGLWPKAKKPGSISNPMGRPPHPTRWPFERIL